MYQPLLYVLAHVRDLCSILDETLKMALNGVIEVEFGSTITSLLLYDFSQSTDQAQRLITMPTSPSHQAFKFVDQTAKVRQKFRYDESRPTPEVSRSKVNHRGDESEVTRIKSRMEGTSDEASSGGNSSSHLEERRSTSLRLLRVALGLEHQDMEPPPPEIPHTDCSKISVMFYGHCPYSVSNK